MAKDEAILKSFKFVEIKKIRIRLQYLKIYNLY